jgi:hypothetical protein
MNRHFLSLGLLVLAAAAPASATTLTYSDRSTWESQITSLSNFDMGTQTVGTVSTFNTAGGLALTDLQIVGYNVTGSTGYDLQRVNASAGQPWYQWNSGTILRSGDKTDSNTVYLHLAFSNPVSAFGFDLGAGGGTPGSVSIAADGLDPITINTNNQPNFAFWGIVSDAQSFSFADLYINTSGHYLVLDNIAKGVFQAPAGPPPAETPEPGTLAHFGIGAGLVFFARRRFRSVSE